MLKLRFIFIQSVHIFGVKKVFQGWYSWNHCVCWLLRKSQLLESSLYAGCNCNNAFIFYFMSCNYQIENVRKLKKFFIKSRQRFKHSSNPLVMECLSKSNAAWLFHNFWFKTLLEIDFKMLWRHFPDNLSLLYTFSKIWMKNSNERLFQAYLWTPFIPVTETLNNGSEFVTHQDWKNSG